MPLPSPNLDDRDFNQLVEEALRVVRRRCPAWTDLSPSDPGVVLLEAFAHLTEMTIYRLNRVPEKAYIALLNLIGVQPYPPSAANVELTFSLREARGTKLEIPVGTLVSTPRTDDGSEGPVFETLAAGVLEVGQTEVTVPAAHCESVKGELCGTGTGMPGQSVRVARAPIVAPNLPGMELLVGVELDDSARGLNALTLECEGKSFRIWREVESFNNLGDERYAYVVDRYGGLITFAPSLRTLGEGGVLRPDQELLAEVPPSGQEIRVWYRHGGGSSGNVRPGTLSNLKPPIDGISVTNVRAASGGTPAESLENAIARGPLSLRSLERAVTARDFELLAVRSSGGVNRALACADAALWVHGAPGAVNVTVIPSLDDATSPVTLQLLRDSASEATLQQVKRGLDARRPLGTSCVVNWARYKSVHVKADITVYPGEDGGALRLRVVSKLNQLIDPLSRGSDRPGWPFGRSITTWDVLRSIGAQAGIAGISNVRLRIDAAPDRDVATLARDAFQADTWYTASGQTAYRSGNNGDSWETLCSFEGEEVTLVDAYRPESGNEHSRAGLLCIVTKSSGGSRLHLSKDCGNTFREVGQFQFEVQAVAWIFRDRSPALFLATPSGLYELLLEAGTAPQQLLFDDTHPTLGANSVAISCDPQGQTLVAVAGSGDAGVYISTDSGRPGSFQHAGLAGELVRVLVVQHTAAQRFLWSGVSAAGRAAGNGCFRARLGSDGADVDGWQAYAANWSAGSCRALAHDGRYIYAGSLRLGVLRLDPDDPEPVWHTPDVSCGLPMRDVSRLQPVNALAAAPGQVISGGPRGLHRSRDSGVSYECCSETEFENEVRLPETWVFCSAEHEIAVRTSDG